MTGRLRVLVAVLCGAAMIGGAAWAERSGQTNQIATPATGAEAVSVNDLIEAARLRPLIEVIATEGLRHGLDLEAAMFPGQGGDAWADQVASIQAPPRLTAMLEQVLAVELAPDVQTDAVTFYQSPLGSRIVEREVAARREMLDDTVEALALDSSGDGARMVLIDELIEAMDLVSANVSGGLNANYAFYRGLSDGGAMRDGMSERDMLTLIWGQEAEVRDSTVEWLNGYLTLAYAPLSDDDLRAYIAWAGTPTGRRLNAALFTGFGQVFEETSYELGIAAARFLQMTDT